MGCVNKASKEFKDLAARHNLDSKALELITHKYWLQTGNETLFPTEVYIQAQLGNTSYQESGKSVRELWNLKYNTPQEYHNMQDLQKAKAEALNYFPSSAVVNYKNAKGNYVLSIKRPVKKVTKDKVAYFKGVDNSEKVKNAKVLDIGVKENQSYGIGKARELYDRFNIDKTSKEFSTKIFDIADKLNLHIEFRNSLPKYILGRYETNTIILKKSFFETDIDNNKKAPIILHEFLHALTIYALSDSENIKSLNKNKDLENFRTEMNSIYQDLKNNPILKEERGIVDVREFVAELANPVFRSKLQEIDKQNKKKQSFWQRILNAFKSLLGLHVTNSYYQRSMNALDKALNAFDIDTYMKYNGVKNIFRELHDELGDSINSMSDEELKAKVNNYFYSKTYNYEIDNSNINDQLSDNEKKDILRAIRTINEAKRSLIDTGGDFLYIVDHTDKDGLNHLENGQEGFLVKEIIDIRGLSKEEINEIKSIGNEEGAIRTLQDFNRGLERIGYKSSIYNSDSIDAKDKATNHDNAGLDKQTLEGKTRRGQSTQNSQDDFQGGQIKTGFDGTNHPRYMDADTTREFINSMSAKDLRDELNLVNQESADYDLVNGVEEKPKHSGKAVPQDFTFNDGTTVKAPFRPNAQQVDALNTMSDFIKSNETSMTLSGYAGTGKTSIMEMIAKKCRANYRNVVFCASTNKAAAVLNDKVRKAGFEAKTLNKIFGIQVEIDPNSKEYDARNTRNKINEDALLKQGVYPGTTVIIDEASMINEENYNIINRMAKDFGLKIIYVGDPAQLAPVKEKEISKVFRNGDGKVITLTQVERTDDNAILKEATDLRNDKPLSGESSFNNKGEGVAYVSPQNRESINNILAHYVKELKNNPNAFRVLAYTNAVVARYNQQIRHLLGYDTAIPQAGEPMTGYNNWGYDWKTQSYRLINSESYKVVKTSQPKKTSINLGNGKVITMEAIPVTLEDSLGKVDTFDFMDVKTNPQNRQAATILANEKKALWAKWRTTPGKKAKTDILGQINVIDKFLFINDNIEYKDNKGKSHLLQSKVIEFGYAMTVHKSQGSTFTNVLIDDVDIQKGALQQNNNNNATNAWEAVDIGNNEERDGSKDTMISSEAVDLFGNAPTETATPTQTTAPKQDNNLVQQLEYVAVSRATDTVTVISNNIKKEGSPLHPEATQSSKTEEHKAPVNPKGSTINSTPQRSDNEITKQVVDHLKSIPGIKVLDRSAMAEFLKTHNPKYLQQMTTPQGEVYGFVDKDGNIYLDETKISPEHPIHEYTHLWDRAVQKHNPKLWDRGVELMKQTSLWNDVANDEHYGKQWQSMNLPKEKLESLIASEVHSRIVGENGEKLLTNIAKRKGQSGIIAKLKQWILDMWKEVKATFGSWSNEDLDALTLNDFNHMTVRDFVDSTNLKDATDASYTEQQSKELKTVNEVWENLGGYFEGTGLNINKDFPNASEKDISTLEDNYMAPDRYPLTDSQIIEIGNRIINSNTINNGTEEYKTTDEFRRVQEASRRFSEKGVSKYNTGEKLLNDEGKRRLGGILGRLLDPSSNGSSYAFKSDLTHTNKNGNVGHFRIGEVNGKLFHDIFEVVRTYLKNGELVDLHEDYSDCKCFVTDDGLCGFAIEPNGNLVSVFSLSPDSNKGFLHAIKDMVREEGATHLDAYMSNKQPLQEIYKKTLGFYPASIMDYNMDYDQNDIAKNHNMPQVVFMVDHEVADVKHFDKDSYTEAQQYQLDQLKESNKKTEPTINIYAGTNENADLSNFAQRPFIVTNVGEDASGPMAGNFKTVEGAFQAQKLFYSNLSEKEQQTLLQQLEKASGGQARSIGRKIRGLDRAAWDNVSSSLMYNLLLDSFRQNPKAEERLLATGNATLTHKQDKGKWGKEFPRLLMKVREELKNNKNDFSDVFQVPTSSEVEVEDVMKPWRDDSGKSNKTRRIYLKGQRDKGYFEVVKDMEDNNYSVHFKPTDDKNPNAFAQEEKATLFQAVADVIPEGANLSTWGELSRGGVHGLNRFANLGFTKTGERKAKMKTGEDITIPVFTKVKEDSTVENPLTVEGQIQMVSLPGYELSKGLPDAVPVDAEWKISYLKELDAQLSMRKSEEENQNILNQMDTILQSPNEKEYLEDLKHSKEDKTEKQLSEYDKLNKQIDNLLDGRVMYEGEELTSISASEVRHVAQLVADEISDFITELQQDGSKANEWFPTFTGYTDFSKVSRKDIVAAVGINNLIQRAKDFMDTEKYPIDDTDASLQADLIFDNWDAIMYLAADVFAFNEGFGITKDYTKGNFTTTEDKGNVGYDNFNDYSSDPDAMAEGEKDEQEHWQIESRTIDVLNSMSSLVRQGLHQCYLLDENNEKVMSIWNLPERVNPRKVTNSILRWCQGSQSFEDMIAKLSEKRVKNPWLSQLIDRLSDKSGNETDFQSQFYSVFTKDFQNYSIVKLENGKYYSMPVNSHPALSEAMNTITTQYKIGQLPLFGVDGKIRKDILGTKNTVGENYTFNFHKALVELQSIDKALKEGSTLNEDIAKKATANVAAVCKNFGYYVTEDMVSDVMNAENISKFAEYMRYLVGSLDEAAASKEEYDPFKFHGKNSIDGTLRNFLTPITDVLEDTAVNAFYDSGKMYQSYVTPSYLTRLFKKFKTLSGQKFEDFIMNEYGSSGLFKDEKFSYDRRKGWKNRWLQLLANDENARKVFDHKVELNFNKHNYMRNMTDAEYTVSLITEYFSTNQEGTAWFRIPMMSNKPSSEFIKFYTYTGDTYKDGVTMGLHDIFLQEVSRIQTVKRRNYSKNDPEFIKNFDTNGRKFCFLPVLNAYLNNSAFDISHRDVIKNEDGSVSSDNARFAALLQKYVEGETELTSEEGTELDKLVDKVLKQSTEDRVQDILEKWEKDGILAAAKNIKGIYPSEFDTSKLIKDEDRDNVIMREVRKQVENFLWNDTLASKNILELMISDIAFYKDTEDLQKRLAQLHAPGLRGRKGAVDYDGKRVSDGNYRTVVLKDFDSFISNIVANINEVFDRRIASAKDEKQKQVLISLKDSLTRPRTYNPDGSVKDKGGKYWNINVADAQGFSSPASYRKKAFIFGRWSKDAEALYQKIVEGKANYTDFETAFQPLKPFVYGKLTKNMGVDKAPIHSMQVPFQAKNSEYLLIMADAILKGEELSRPNLLRAVYRIMEDSEKLMPTKGIDTIQFESAIKSGLQGTIDISQYIDMPGGEEAAYTFMKNQIFKEEYNNNTKERVYRNYNTDTFVHELSYDNYCLQQEIPEHFKNHSQAHGSQIRMITPSDLDYYTTDENGNQVENYYEWTEPTGKYDSEGKPIYTKKRMKADEVRKEYEDTIAENIKESINTLTAELHLDSKNPRERNLAISKILQREIMSSPRYGIDLMQACSIDKKTGEFRIPKGDPIQAKRIEQLLNSIIKNRINKQKIAGGPIVQVSNFGTSKQLHIRFNDKQGNLIPLEEEYDSAEHNNMSYKEYLKKNQGGIAYFEVYAPMWDNKLFDMFSNPDGTINIDAIEATDPELLKMVSYRIPTEDKYSCAPMKVVGFMPKEAGDAIMLPYELTEIDDSDFDIDKRYVMRKELPIKKRSRKEINKKLFDIVSESYKAAHGGKTNNKWIGEQINMFLDNPQRMRNNDKFMQWMYNQYQKVAFYIDVPTSGKLYRDNKIVDMTLGILTNEMTADKILNPGGFDAPKKMGYMVAAYKNPENKYSWEELQSMSIDDLKDLSYTEKDITFADVQVQFYKQNAAAASLIGVFAVNKVAHATLEGNDIRLDISEICGDYPFNIAGHYEKDPQTGENKLVGGKTFGGRMLIDTKFDSEGNLIGKTLGSLVSASADAVKDPILNLMNINMTTAGMLNTMLRLGMTFNDAALFLSQNIIERMLDQYNKENLDNYVPLDNIINKWIITYQEKEGFDDSSSINNEPLLKEELIEGLTSKEHSKIDYKVLIAFQKIKALTDAMRNPTYITRFNSISSAVGPLIIDNLIMEHKLEAFTQSDNKKLKTNFYTGKEEMVDAKTIYKDHPILEQFSRAIGIAQRVFSDMPSGSSAFRECLNKLPENISDIMYRDKKLLDQFANFYQSYLLIQSGVVDEKELKDTVEKFPEEFIKKDYKNKYPNNALIQAIKMNILKKTGKPYLQINITGMDEQQKEELRAAWVDLHKADPELSKKLFDYSFFKAGVGFSPKTFMALVPTYVKERIVGKNNASYIDTYRHFPEVIKDLVVEQFILNNLDNNKIAPWKGGKDTHYSIDLKEGTLKVYDQNDIKDLNGISYMKTKGKNSTYCWKYKGKLDSGDLIYELVKPLGNNKEYLEMSTSTITTPLSEVKEVTEDNDTSSMKESSSAETDNGDMIPSVVSNLEKTKKMEEIVDLIMKQVPRYSKQEATEVFKRIENDPNKKRFAKFLQNVFKQKGLDLDINGVIDEFNKYC